jgi:dethiobiotin synthetase
VTRCVYLVGTDTGVGKTSLACALLRRAGVHGLRIVPFKPAQSGADDGPSDIERLLLAAGLPRSQTHRACPFRYDPPLAPGLAEHADPFLGGPAASFDALSQARDALDAWIAQHRPDLVLIEGAGGLHVPMPGGTWQDAWIEALADCAVIVGRAGLGTINHTLLTIDAVRALDLSLAGFYLSDVTGAPDPSRTDNAAVITHARGVPHLGTLPHRHTAETSDDGIDPLAPLLATCG